MALKNIFSTTVNDETIARVNSLSATTPAQWGKMNVSQMLAHCCVSYEMTYEDKHPKPNAFVRFMLKSFVKKNVTNEAPYKKNGPTAKTFIISGARDFEVERARLIGFLNKTQALGEAHFDQKESPSFGVMTTTEWNNLFYKHLDHHLTQFGV